MSPLFVLAGVFAVAAGVVATLKPEFVFRRENPLFEEDGELTAREAALVQRGAGAVTGLIGVVLLSLGIR